MTPETVLFLEIKNKQKVQKDRQTKLFELKYTLTLRRWNYEKKNIITSINAHSIITNRMRITLF